MRNILYLTYNTYDMVFELFRQCMVASQKSARKESAFSSLYGKQQHHRIANQSGALARAS